MTHGVLLRNSDGDTLIDQLHPTMTVVNLSTLLVQYGGFVEEAHRYIVTLPTGLRNPETLVVLRVSGSGYYAAVMQPNYQIWVYSDTFFLNTVSIANRLYVFTPHINAKIAGGFDLYEGALVNPVPFSPVGMQVLREDGDVMFDSRIQTIVDARLLEASPSAPMAFRPAGSSGAFETTLDIGFVADGLSCIAANGPAHLQVSGNAGFFASYVRTGVYNIDAEGVLRVKRLNIDTTAPLGLFYRLHEHILAVRIN